MQALEKEWYLLYIVTSEVSYCMTCRFLQIKNVLTNIKDTLKVFQSAFIRINIQEGFVMVVKLNCKKSEIIVSGVTRYHSPEVKQALLKQALFFQKLLQKLHEVTFK